jgi:anti-sigma regulatory factor (Ser/Thr protein kinase)
MYYEINDYNALRAALHNMCEQLQKQLVGEQSLFHCKLAASELLSNVLQHGGGRAYLTAEIANGVVIIRVKADNEYRPPEESKCSDVDCEYGRGLYIIDTICESREYSEGQGICVTVRITEE